MKFSCSTSNLIRKILSIHSSTPKYFWSNFILLFILHYFKPPTYRFICLYCHPFYPTDNTSTFNAPLIPPETSSTLSFYHYCSSPVKRVAVLIHDFYHVRFSSQEPGSNMHHSSVSARWHCSLSAILSAKASEGRILCRLFWQPRSI